LVIYLAASDGRGWRAGLIASLMFLALGAPGSGPVPWTSLYKEDSLALALVLASVALLARQPRTRPGIGAAGLPRHLAAAFFAVVLAGGLKAQARLLAGVRGRQACAVSSAGELLTRQAR